MMGRPPRQPIDLQAVTKDVKAKIRRVIGELERSNCSRIRFSPHRVMFTSTSTWLSTT